jgi:hypothetical protein
MFPTTSPENINNVDGSCNVHRKIGKLSTFHANYSRSLKYIVYFYDLEGNITTSRWATVLTLQVAELSHPA